MQFIVYMMAFGEEVPIPERVVDVPDAEIAEIVPGRLTEESRTKLLELIYYYGQNDFQPRSIRSVSVGDVAKLSDGSLHRVRGIGWETLPEGTDINNLERGHACSLL